MKKPLKRNECNVLLHLRPKLESLLDPLQCDVMEQVHIRPGHVSIHLDLFVFMLLPYLGVFETTC